jgi:uncharacterized protein
MNALVIDAFEFCRLKESRAGENPVADFPRLADESTGKAGAIRWSVRGGMDKLGHAQLTLAIDGSVNLTCQRCLKPLEFVIESESVLLLAKDEVSAEQTESLVDEECDVIVVPSQCNLAELIEDEVLLAIPLSPKHEICPGPVAAQSGEPDGNDESAARPSPFAALKNWKQ